jgi:hypothetical protein
VDVDIVEIVEDIADVHDIVFSVANVNIYLEVTFYIEGN